MSSSQWSLSSSPPPGLSRMKVLDLGQGVVEVVLARNKVNALDGAFLQQIVDVFDWVDAAKDVNAVLLTSASAKAFSAGLDLKYAMSIQSEKEAIDYIQLVDYALARPLRCSKPVAAAVNGHAIAGGFVLACACDFVAVRDSAKARYGLTEVRVGVPFPRQAFETVRHHMQNARGVRDMVYTGRLMSGAEAFKLGFGDVLCSEESVRDTALAWLRSMTKLRPGILRHTKLQVNFPFFQQIAPTSTDQEPHRTGHSESLSVQAARSARLMVAATRSAL